jgi:hypothetical protein
LPARAPSRPHAVVSARRRLGAYALDLIVATSPFVVFFGVPARGNWGVVFAVIFGLGSCVPLFLVLQGTSLFRRGRTLGMAYFGLELAPRRSFGVAFFSALQWLVVGLLFGVVYDFESLYLFEQSAGAPAWIASALFALVVLAPNLLSMLLPGHRSLAERICRTRLVESEAARGASPRSRRRGYVVDVLIFTRSSLPCWLMTAATGGDEQIAALRPGILTAGTLLVFQLCAWLRSRETIGIRAWRSTPQTLDTGHNLADRQLAKLTPAKYVSTQPRNDGT